MSNVVYQPPHRIKIPTPIASIEREYQRGIHNRSNSGYRASIRLSTSEGEALEEACKILQIDDLGTYMRWCAVRSAEEIIFHRKQWEKADATG